VIPSPWIALVLVLAIFRVVRLIGWDTFPPLIRLRDWITGARVVTAGSTNARMRLTNEQVETHYEFRWPTLAEGISCAYCASIWIGSGVYIAWLAWPKWTLYVAAPLAVSTAVGLIARWLDF
jgi:Protein of unknown function (DUF1360)